MKNCTTNLFCLAFSFLIYYVESSENKPNCVETSKNTPCEGISELSKRFDALEEEVRKLRKANSELTESVNLLEAKGPAHPAEVIDFNKYRRYLLNGEALGTAFSVTISTSGITNLGVNQTIHFDKVVSNLGNCFDTNMSFFKAPVNGWYAFSVTLMARPHETQYLYVMKNGLMAFHVYSSGTDFTTDSRTMVLHLDLGDEVWVQTSESPVYSSNVHGGEHTSFTGFLLYVD